MFKRMKGKIKEAILSGSAIAGERTLAVISFFEPTIFPIPADVFVIWMTFRFKQLWFRNALNASLYSLAGGIFGYIIGLLFFDLLGRELITIYGLKNEFLQIGEFLLINGFLTILIASISPIPYRVFTIAGGLFGMNVFVFALATIMGRFPRYLIVSYLAKILGEKFEKQILRYFNFITLVFGVLMLSLLIYVFLN